MAGPPVGITPGPPPDPPPPPTDEPGVEPPVVVVVVVATAAVGDSAVLVVEVLEAAVVLVVVEAAVVLVVVDEVVEHVGTVMVLVSRLTCPLRARTRPETVAPVSTVAEVSAKMVPTNEVPVPSVAELPTCQNTLHAWAPLIRLTVLFEAVINVDPAWKMNTEFGLFCPSNVTVPVSPIPEAEL